MHDIIEQMKAGLEDLAYRIPDNAWERFQVKEQKQPILVKKRNFFFLKAAAIFLLISVLTLHLQKEQALITSITVYKSSKLSSNKSLKASEKKQLGYRSKVLEKQATNQTKSDSLFGTDLIKTATKITRLNWPATMSYGKSSDSASNLKRVKLDRWILADIISKAKQPSALKVKLGGNRNEPNWYLYEKTNGNQSLIVKSKLEEHPSKYSSYNSHHSSEARLPQDFSLKQGASGGSLEASQAEASSRAGSPGEVGSVGSEGLNSPPATRPSTPSWPSTGPMVSPLVKTGGLGSVNSTNANSTSSKTRSLQNLEFYNLSIGFKQKLKKDQAIKFEPFIRIPVTGLQNKHQFNYNQYGLKIGLSF